MISAWMHRISLAIITATALASCSRATLSAWNVADYGAVADTLHYSTNAIQEAVNACASHGGGRVVVPAGNYLVGTIVLRSNVELYLSQGATLYASRDVTRFRNLPLGGADVPSQEMLIMANNQNNVAITGLGRIHCQAVRETYQREPVDTIGPVTDFITGREVRNAARYGADYRTKWRKVPPCPTAINLIECNNVTISGITVEESSSWGVHLQWCDNVIINRVTIKSSEINGVNSDGLDIDGSSNVKISDCQIDTGDDALCLKTTRIGDRTRPLRNVVVTNCILRSSSSAFKLGTESHADFTNITLSNSIIDGANRGVAIMIRDGGNVDGVLLSDLIIRTERKATFWWGNGDPVWFVTQKRKEAETCGSIRNVVMRNVIAQGQSGIRIESFDGPISDIKFSDVALRMEPEINAIDKRSADGFLFKDVERITLNECSVTWNKANPEPTWRYSFAWSGTTDLRINGHDYPTSGHIE